MRRVRRPRTVLAATLVGLSALAACATGARGTMHRPAILQDLDAAGIEALKKDLASAVNRAEIEIGPEDLTRSTSVSVLPPKLGAHETHSLARPIYFDIYTDGENCFVTRRDTGETFQLQNVECALA